MMKFKVKNLKFKVLGNIFSLFFLASCFLLLASSVHADVVIDNGINFLKSKQDQSGRITTGFSAPSQWSAIAFTANGIDVATVKGSVNSLKDFLMSDLPSEPSSATDWETRILAIVAIGSDPTNFGGNNYVSKLETFYNNNQLGDTCSLNDDIFGVLALVSSGSLANTQIKQDSLNFLISQQDPTDGGFGFSAPGCEWYSTSADMTGAGLSALQAAKDNGLTNPGLDNAIARAKSYLLTNQNSDGGFGYFGSSDADTTGWVIISLNAAGMKDSSQATNARNWLLTQQSTTDGGFMAFDYGANALVSNASTTAQALTAMSGKTWILKIFTPVENPSITPSPTVSPTITPTTTPLPSVTPTPIVTSAPTPTPVTINNFLTTYPKPTVTAKDPGIISITKYLPESVATPVPPTAPEVLGESIDKPKQKEETSQLMIKNLSTVVWPISFVIGLYIVVRFWERRWKK